MSRSVALSLLLAAAIVNSACSFRIQAPGAAVVAPDGNGASKPVKSWGQMLQDKIVAATDAAQDKFAELKETEHYKNAQAKLQDVHAGISENIEYLQKEFEKQTPEMKAKFQANIDSLNKKLAELRQTESARFEEIKADLAKGIMELKEKVPPETIEKVKGSFDSMADKLAELEESDSYKAGSAKWNEIERGIARNLDDVQKQIEDATPEVKAKVQSSIDSLREKLKELQSSEEKASPEPTASALLELAEPDDTGASKPVKSWGQMFQDKIVAATDAAQDKLAEIRETEHYKNAQAKLQDVHSGISENIEYLQKEFEKQTPEMKVKFQANIDSLNKKLAELRQTGSARFEETKADLAKGIMELKEKVPPETIEKVKGSFDSMADKLAELEESDSYKAGSAKWNEIERGIARNLDDVQKQIEDATPEVKAKVQSSIDSLREKLKELQSSEEKASPEPTASALLELAEPDDTWGQMFQDKIEAATDDAQDKLRLFRHIEYLQKEFEKETPEMKVKFQANIDHLNEKLAELRQTGSARFEETKADLAKGIMELKEKVPPETIEKVKGSLDSMADKLGSTKWNEIERGIAKNLEEVQKKVEDATPEVQATIDRLREKLKELQSSEEKA